MCRVCSIALIVSFLTSPSPSITNTVIFCLLCDHIVYYSWCIWILLLLYVCKVCYWQHRGLSIAPASIWTWLLLVLLYFDPFWKVLTLVSYTTTYWSYHKQLIGEQDLWSTSYHLIEVEWNFQITSSIVIIIHPCLCRYELSYKNSRSCSNSYWRIIGRWVVSCEFGCSPRHVIYWQGNNV